MLSPLYISRPVTRLLPIKLQQLKYIKTQKSQSIDCSLLHIAPNLRYSSSGSDHWHDLVVRHTSTRTRLHGCGHVSANDPVASQRRLFPIRRGIARYE